METWFQPKTRTASAQAARYSLIGTDPLPGIHRSRAASSSDSTWIPIERAPASYRSCIEARSPGGSSCT